MDSSEGKGRLMERARAARLRKRRELNSPGNHTNEVSQPQTGSATEVDCTLNASEAEYRATLDAMRDAIHVVDRDLRVVLINEKLRKLSEEMGLDVSNFAGRPVFELFPFLSEDVREEYRAVFDEGRVVNKEETQIVGGVKIIAETRRLPIFESGRVAKVVTVIRDIAERKRTERSLRRSEEKLAEAQQIAGLGSWSRRIETNEQVWSDNTYRLFGFEPGEVEPTLETFLNVVHPDDRERVTRQTQEVASQGKPYKGEYRIVRKDGAVRWMHSQANVICNDCGDPVEIIGIAQDITEQRMAEEALRESEGRYRAVVDNAGEGIVVVQDGRLQFFNPYVEATFGIPQEELRSLPFIEFIHPDDRDWVMDIHTRRFKGEEVPPVYEVRIIDQHGNVRWAENSGLLIEWRGRPATLNFLRDITDRKRAEEGLRASKEFAENLVETANALVVALDCDGMVNIFNKFAEELTGYAKQDVLGRDWFEIFIPENERPDIRKVHAAVLEGRPGASSWENVILTSRGERRIIRWNNSQSKDAEGKVTGTMSIGVDITARKQTQEALQRERDRAQSYLDVAAVMMVAIGADQKVTLANRKACEVLGAEERDVVGKNWFDHFLPEKVKDKTKIVFNELIAGKIELGEYVENPVLTLQGEEKLIAWHNTMIRDTAGIIIGTLSSGEDITERRRAEEALRDRESMINDLIETSRDWIWSIDVNGVHTYSNPAVESILGYNPEELIGQSGLDLLHEDDRKMVESKLPEWIAEKRGWTNLVLRWRNKKGGYSYLESNAVPIFDSRDILVGFRGMDRDITERRQTEMELQRNAELLRESQEVANLGHYVYDGTVGTWESSGILDEILGIGPDHPKTTEGWLQIVHPDDRDEMRAYLSQTVFEQGQQFDREYRILRPVDHETRWVHGLGRLEFNEAGKPIRMIGTIQDITERRKAQEAIQLSEEKYRRVVEDQTEFIVRWLPGGIRTFVNESYCRYFGISEEEAIGTSCWPQVAENFHRTLGETIESLTPQNPVSTDEVMVVRPDGTTGWNSWTTRALFNEQDELIEYQAVGRDITERKRTEEELARQRYYLSKAQEIGSIGTWELDIASNNLVWTDETYRIFGLPQGVELTYETFLNCVHPEEREYVNSRWQAAVNGEPYDIEHRIMAEGEVKWVREKADLEFDDHGNCIRAIGLAQDITQRRQAEQTLRDSEEKFRQLVENINEVFWLNDLDSSQVLFVSPTYESIWGQTCQSLYDNPNNWIDSIHPEDRQRVADAFAAGRMDGTYCQEYRIVRPDGSVRWIWDRSFPIHSPDGRVERIAGIAEDITQRKKAQEQLLESQQRFRHAFENANVGMCLVDMAGTITRVNGRMCDIFGYEAEQLQGMSVDEIAHPDDAGISAEFIRRCVSREIESAKFEKRYLRADGHMIWCQVSSSLVRNSIGEPLYFISHVQDITERKKAQDAIEDRLQFEQLLSTISSRFVNLPPCEVDKAIENGLGLIGNFFGVDRVSIGQFVGIEKQPQTTHSWIADGCTWHSGPEVVYACYPNIAARLRDEGKVVYEKPDDIPDEWTQERQFTEATGIKAGLVVALRVGGTVIGAIGINSLQAERCWPDETAERLRLLGDIFANALERKRAEDALVESEAKFKSLAEQSPNMIFINRAGRIVYANMKCEEIMGYKREELYAPDFDFLKLVAPESVDLIRASIAIHSKGQEVPPYEYTVINKAGERTEVINATKLIQYEGETAILGIVTDITDRKRAENELRESEHKFRSYVDNAPDGVIVADGQGRHIEMNEAICNMTGYSRDELLSISIGTLLTPEYEQAGREHFDKVVKNGRASGEFAYLRKDGSVGYWNIDAVKISENVFLAFIKDITDNKKAEEALRASEEKFRSIFETAANLITSVNEEGIIVDCNRRILDMLGYRKEEVIGQSMVTIIHPDCVANAENMLREVLTTGFSYNKEHKMVRKDGSLIDVSINSSVLRDQSGGGVRTLCIIDNITDRKQAELRILDNQAQLKSLASQLSLTEERERRRLATDLHDQIGQSLVISKIKLDQLRKAAGTGEAAGALQEVCGCLEQVIQDTRMLTFDLSSPILYELGFEAAVAEWLADEVRNKYGMQTEFEDDGLPKPLDEDIRALLFRNVRELLINTVKHAKARKVKVSLRKVDSHINVTVQDDGVGFDPVEVRARAAQRAEFGLFSIRERLEQLGGNLEIESGAGQGSRISMVAPLKSEDDSKKETRA